MKRHVRRRMHAAGRAVGALLLTAHAAMPQAAPAAGPTTSAPTTPATAGATAGVAPADASLAVVEERFGFRITRPNERWISYAAEASPGNPSYTLTLYERDTPFLPSAVVYVAPHDGAATAEDVRAAAAATIMHQGQPVLAQDASTLAGRPAARLLCRAVSAAGAPYEAELRYVVVPPFVYALQCNWTADGARPDALFDPLIASFELFAPVVAERDEAAERLDALAARCGSELTWASGWDDAAARAQAEGKPICVVFEHTTVLDLPRTIASGALMDDDLLALLRERFVALRLEIDDPAPFRAPDAWGMGSHAWGGAVLFVSAGGEVLDQVGVPSTVLITDAARRVLAQPGVSQPVPHELAPRDASARHALVARHLRRGDLKAARVMLGDDDSPAGRALRVHLLALERRGDEALTELALARRGADATLLADLAVEEGVLTMRLGHFAEARELLQRAVAAAPESARAAEAHFWLGALEMLLTGYPKGMDPWRQLVAQQPESRWAWKAAANLTSQGSFVNGGERLDWPATADLDAARRPPVARVAIGQVERARRDAIAWLLGSQRADGSWLAPMDGFNVQTTGYTYAVTALCGSSLLPFAAHDDAVAAAVRRAEDYLLAVHVAGGFRAGDDLVGVYSIWGRAYALRFLAQCRAANLGSDGRLGTALDDLLQSVLGSQHAGGGWPYITLASSTGTTGFDPSTSFLTAGVLLALLDVRAAGTAVPQPALDRGLAFLSALRQSDGSFRYMRDAPEAAGNPEAAGRGPVCALALRRGGTLDVDGLAVSMKRFDEQRAALKREWGKEICHTGPEGQGAHYLFFDWAFAAEAVGELPRHQRPPYRRALLQDILDVRDADGAYADMPSLGRAYGTAMALAAFRSLGDTR